MAGPKLNVTDNTSIKDLQKFSQEVGDGAKIRGKTNKDGSITLYASAKKGTGLKNYLFGTTATRRSTAQSAITQILFANTSRAQFGQVRGNQLDRDLTDVLNSLPTRGAELKGAKLKELAGLALDAREAVRLPDALPGGVRFDLMYNLSGGQTIAKVPSDCKGQFGGHKGLDIAQVLEEVKQKSLEGGPDKFVEIDGQKITSQAEKDFWRLNFDIPLPNGTHFNSDADPSEDGKVRNENATKALRAFTGSDKATTVLSSVLSQTTLTPLPGCITKPDGTQANLKFASAFSKVGRDHSVKGSDGKLTPIDPQFVGGAKWKLSKVGEDFKISVSWLAHCEASEGHESELPLHKDGLIGVQFDVDFIVSGRDAKNGKLQLTMPGGIRTTFSGQLTV